MEPPKPLSNTTPFPNRLLDEAMPLLKDTEWRLLCVIVRQTLGWSAGEGRRKERDWLTHSQLKARTSRASAAVSQGLDGLVRHNLIEVRNEVGELLLTPQERRRARGQLFYRLHPRLLTPALVTIPESEVAFSQSGLRKAKTTKENETKDLKDFLYFSESEKLLSICEEVFEPMEVETVEPPGMGQGEASGNPAIAGLVDLYRELYRQHLGREAPEIVAEDYRLLARRLERHGAGELEWLLPAFFSSGFGYASRQHYSLTSFLNTIEILKMATGKKQMFPPTEVS